MINSTNVLLQMAEKEELPYYVIESHKLTCNQIFDYVCDL
jgi:hypothetical protein